MNKIIDIAILASMVLIAQEDQYSIFGGASYSTISFNESDINDYIDVSDYFGYVIGLEAKKGTLIAGIRYLQRGSNYNVGEFIWAGYYYSQAEGYLLFNYVSLYGYYTIPLINKLSALGGLSYGFPLDGESKEK